MFFQRALRTSPALLFVGGLASFSLAVVSPAKSQNTQETVVGPDALNALARMGKTTDVIADTANEAIPILDTAPLPVGAVPIVHDALPDLTTAAALCERRMVTRTPCSPHSRFSTSSATSSERRAANAIPKASSARSRNAASPSPSRPACWRHSRRTLGTTSGTRSRSTPRPAPSARCAVRRNSRPSWASSSGEVVDEVRRHPSAPDLGPGRTACR